MKIYEIFEKLQDKIRNFKNPLESISPTNPIFGEMYDRFDEVIYNNTVKEITKDAFESMPYLKQNKLHLQTRSRLATKQSIPVSEIITTETHLEKNHLNNLLIGKKKLGLAELFHYKNKYYVIDGNHRIVASYILGKQKNPDMNQIVGLVIEDS